MDIVSSESDQQKKEQLLKERREKLSRWKLQKAKHDAAKSRDSNTQETPATSQYSNTNPNNTGAKFSERRSKLDAWKNKKRQADEVQKPDVKSKKVKKRAQKKRLTFDDDEEELIKQPVNIFIPSTDTTAVEQQEEQSVSSENHDIDVLDTFMNELKKTDNALDHQNRTSTHTDNNIFAEDLEDRGESISDPEDDTQSAQYRKIAKMKQLRKVTEVKYNKNELEPFQKEFYIEQDDIKNITAEEVAELRLNLDNIKIKGTNCPNPIQRWSQLGLSTVISNMIVNKLKFKNLTPIQSQALPAIMSGRDVIGISKTGSGKTISYLLPLIRHIKAQRDLYIDETGPIGLVLAPTRELALQIYEEAKIFIDDDKGMSCICCTGGSELKKQINDLKRGVKIVVATPGRFIDLLTLNSGKLVSTRRITFVVIDEADRLFDMGFEPQITQIMKSIRPDKQCVLFSATFPKKLRSFALRLLREPLSITVNSSNMVNERVQQSFVICDSANDKFNILLSILQKQDQTPIGFIENDSDIKNHHDDDEIKEEKTIIFVASQQICDLVEKRLNDHGFEIFTIHAGKQYQERITNLEKFKTTKNSILLCTEVMSRGLNVPEVSLVVIYNAIKTFAQYVHTTGRTARGNNHGSAITILESDELAAAYILIKAMSIDQLNTHPVDQVKKLKFMSQEFETGMNSGKFRLSTGFGGKGLDNLDTKREAKELQERSKYENESGEKITSNKKIEATVKETQSELDGEVSFPKLNYEMLEESNSDGSTIVSAHVYTNDLPQLVRWEVTKNTTLTFIKNETGCSVTNKGKYYPPGEGPKNKNDAPKLYLLIEGKEEKDLALSIELLEEKAREGIKKVEFQALKTNKF